MKFIHTIAEVCLYLMHKKWNSYVYYEPDTTICLYRMHQKNEQLLVFGARHHNLFVPHAPKNRSVTCIWSPTPQFVCTACTKKPNSYVYLEPDTTICLYRMHQKTEQLRVFGA